MLPDILIALVPLVPVALVLTYALVFNIARYVRAVQSRKEQRAAMDDEFLNRLLRDGTPPDDYAPLEPPRVIDANDFPIIAGTITANSIHTTLIPVERMAGSPPMIYGEVTTEQSSSLVARRTSLQDWMAGQPLTYIGYDLSRTPLPEDVINVQVGATVATDEIRCVVSFADGTVEIVLLPRERFPRSDTHHGIPAEAIRIARERRDIPDPAQPEPPPERVSRLDAIQDAPVVVPLRRPRNIG